MSNPFEQPPTSSPKEPKLEEEPKKVEQDEIEKIPEINKEVEGLEKIEEITQTEEGKDKEVKPEMEEGNAVEEKESKKDEGESREKTLDDLEQEIGEKRDQRLAELEAVQKEIEDEFHIKFTDIHVSKFKIRMQSEVDKMIMDIVSESQKKRNKINEDYKEEISSARENQRQKKMEKILKAREKLEGI